MNQEEISTLLNQVALLETDITGEYEIPVKTKEGKEFFGEESRIEQHISSCSYFETKYFQKVLGWLPANPSKKDIVDAIKSVYVFTKRKPTEPSNFVNTEEGNQQLFIELTETDEIQTFFLVGPKGSGKTFYLNYLFNTKTPDFYNKKLIWYRAELSKLYKHNITTLDLTEAHESDDVGPYTLEEYLNTHIAYVSLI